MDCLKFEGDTTVFTPFHISKIRLAYDSTSLPPLPSGLSLFTSDLYFFRKMYCVRSTQFERHCRPEFM